MDADGRSVLKCRVRAKPIEGQANAALVALLARALGAPKSAVSILRGDQSRTKAVQVRDLSLGEIRDRLGGS